ncbi:asparaginyl tRNA synthetase [Candidatus Desulfarcum epimagneticum]|uniref:Asparagine--tRNA ligase n=1 Tax=uncultured Desulfobacteraceae bacterium TaxID=218296 RepID=A0A484HBZ7_9BACT|nr:asparaginyl tRNA synthetase [uncultured Desulfobacteraceae bacterium]
MKRVKIKALLGSRTPLENVCVKGWVKTRRDASGFSFIEINDGSCLKNIQAVADPSSDGWEDVRSLTTGSAAAVSGDLIESKGKGQKWELAAKKVAALHIAPSSFPLQKKRHTDAFLRGVAHLRPRTNKYGAAFRIRSDLSHAIHTFFKDRGFVQLHAPIITGSDCEGAGALFRVAAPGADGSGNDGDDFFGARAHLSVSGQLSAEMFALALGDVYVFGPTFRAENSHTRRHAAEFWMVEPEMAFCDLEGNMDLGEELIQFLAAAAMDECMDDLALFDRFVAPNLIKTLEKIARSDFARVSYTEAVDRLERSGKKFERPVSWGADLQSEHERCLTEDIFQKPVILFDYPEAIKPFYMRLNDDGKTVAAMDILVPGIGEIIGGSQREERLDALKDRMAAKNVPAGPYQWYLDSRLYGSVTHSGFGMGFERLMMMVTGISNIRDVLPFPRTPGSIDF